MNRKTELPHLRLRVGTALLSKLEKAAENNGRTLTGEIVDRLAASFRREDIRAYIEETAHAVAEKMQMGA
jgi:hypothetical protein